MTTIRRWTMLLAAACFLGTPAARAETLVLDGATGADYDSVGDGWFFAGSTPPLPAPDGVGDSINPTLAIGFLDGVLGLRAMAEFPLALLAGVAPTDIESAILTVTIDDVIGTFGPGAAFDGTASDPFESWSYEGDGAVTTTDFAPPDAAFIESVPVGVITDASLAVSGAQAFQIDVTEQLRNAVDFEFAAFGVMLSTVDHASATSFDNLGVSGAAFPYITVEITDGSGTTTSTTVAGSTTTSTSVAPATTTSTSVAPETTTSTSVAPASTTSTSVAPATTTSTSVAPASTTSTSLAAETTTTTSTSTTSTTSTSLPQGCGDDATIASIGCRAEALATEIADNQAGLGTAFAKLQKNMSRIVQQLDDASEAIDAGNTKKARSLLRKVGGRYRALGRPLRSKTGRENIDEALRNSLLAAIDDLRADTKALMQSL